MKKKNILIFIIFMLVAVITRFIFLGLRPVHHDEGMLSYFAWELSEGRGYNYSPQIHGPILFYLQAIIFKLFGTADNVLRGSTALFGVILAGLPFLYHKVLRQRKAIAISALIISSPILTYFARFLVHTSLVIVINFVIVLNLWLFIKKPKNVYLYILAVFLALAFGISETSYIFVLSIILFAFFCYLIERKLFLDKLKNIKAFLIKNYLDFISAFLFFVLSWILIYSVGLSSPKSFLLSLPNPFDAEEGLGFWLAQHQNQLGGQPWFYYLLLLIVYEPIVFLGGILAAIELVRKRGGFLQSFTVFLAFASLIGYSIAGEKFPWLLLPTLLLFVISAGLYFGRNFTKSTFFTKFIVIVLLIFTLFNTYRLNFTNPADTRELVTYVQTPNSFKEIADEIIHNCEGVGGECVIIDSDISWPLSWEFRKISFLDYFNNAESIKPKTKYIFVNPDKMDALSQANFSSRKVLLRDWWVPPVCRKLACANSYLRYFVSRTIWGSKGGYDIMLLERK